MICEIDHPMSGPIRVVGSPLRLAETPPTVRRAPPLLGQHTDEVLGDWLDYDDKTVRKFGGEGAFG